LVQPASLREKEIRKTEGDEGNEQLLPNPNKGKKVEMMAM
jgi:hypothetical protein